MNAKMSVFVIYVEVIIYSLLYNLHDCTFKLLFYIKKLLRKYFDKFFLTYGIAILSYISENNSYNPFPSREAATGGVL